MLNAYVTVVTVTCLTHVNHINYQTSQFLSHCTKVCAGNELGLGCHKMLFFGY